ncbi:COMM domain-containing protein 3-like [Amphiura filiformis]|uniref:COMM domain-containing protein 3-like n=1 Tax=Amphiura filiformis TaxID=82378 RepID=UPI003B20BC24
MELSTEVQEGLQLAGDAAHVPDKIYPVLLKKVFRDVFVRPDAQITEGYQELKAVDPAALKQTYAALCTLILEAAKHDAENSSISSTLEDCKFSADRIETFANAFLDKKEELRALLSNIGYTHPHVVDVDWRLDYYMKNNHIDKINEPTYLITLKTEVGSREGTKDVQFCCSQEQLQDLVGKLKDATKSLEKASQAV